MAIMENVDQDIGHMNQLWSIISELSEQLNQNRSIAVTLYGQAEVVNTQAVHGQTGFVLRRFNLDKPKDAYDTELERMNASMTADNHSLQRDNKQLNALIKEYEQTLETVMSAFRNRAHEVEKHELELIKDFESRMLELQDEDISKRLMDTSAQSESLARLSRLVRQFMRTIGGEDTDRPLPDENGKRIEDFDPLEAPSSAEWALERECELARLERENEELRRMLGAEVQDSRAETKRDAGLMHRPPTTVPSHDNRTLGAALTRTGSAGPYGTFKNINVRSAG